MIPPTSPNAALLPAIPARESTPSPFKHAPP